jgi:ABC-type transporter Mla subunit MlaD
MSTQTPRRGMRPRDALGRIGERHAFAAGLAGLAVIAFGIWIAATSVNTPPLSSPLRIRAIVPAAAPIIRAGDDIRVGGVRVGAVVKVAPTHDAREVTLAIETGTVGQGASVQVRQQGFSGSVFLELTRGDPAHPLAREAIIPLSRSGTNVDLVTIAGAFDTDSRHAITQSLAGYGGGLAGRGEDLSATIGALPELTRDLPRVADGLTPAPGVLDDLMHQFALSASGFAPVHDGSLAPFLSDSRASFAVTAAQAPAIGQLIENLPGFENASEAALPIAEPLLSQAGAMARELAPALADVHSSLPALNALLADAGDLPALSRIAQAAQPVLREGVALEPELAAASAPLAPFFSSYQSLAQGVNPYDHDIVRSLQLFKQWTGFPYADGMASGQKAVRFGPVFTCANHSLPYPAPGQAATVHATGLPQGTC